MDKALIANKAMKEYPLLRKENYVTAACPVCNNEGDTFTICNHDSMGFPAQYSVCKKCGNVYFSKIPTRQGYSIFYDKIYDHRANRNFEYYKEGERKNIETYLESQILAGDEIVNYCQKYLCGGVKVLDIGCAMGGVMKPFQDRFNAECYGVEPILQQVKIAREVLGVDTIHHGMAEELNDVFQEGMKFDLIIIKAGRRPIPQNF